jgi:predicted enzyme involved in methoxymalonyl-ACP biosynthesis
MDLWLMSCRVLKRDMEFAMLDAVADRAGKMGVNTIFGYYIPTRKNGMVSDFYSTLGFQPSNVLPSDLPEGSTAWKLDLAGYNRRNRHIKILEYSNA